MISISAVGLVAVWLLLQAAAVPSDDSVVNARFMPPNEHGSWYGTQNIHSLPSWEAAASSKPLCEPGSNLYDGKFYTTGRGEVLYEPERCLLKRLTGAEARTCLANKTIIFIGDSITRYQYMSFAHFLAHERYPSRYGDDADQPSVCMETQWKGGWPEFFANTSRQLSSESAAFAAREICNCSRPGGLDSSTYEDRHLQLRLSDSQHPAHVHVLMYTALMWPDMRTALHKALQRGLKGRKAHFTVANIGAWFSRDAAFVNMDPNKTAEAFAPTFSLHKELSPHTRMIWRTMSDNDSRVRANVSSVSQTLSRAAQAHGWSLLDIHRVSNQGRVQGVPMRWDEWHFLPAMYDQWNDLLLHEMCS